MQLWRAPVMYPSTIHPTYIVDIHPSIRHICPTYQHRHQSRRTTALQPAPRFQDRAVGTGPDRPVLPGMRVRPHAVLALRPPPGATYISNYDWTFGMWKSGSALSALSRRRTRQLPHTYIYTRIPPPPPPPTYIHTVPSVSEPPKTALPGRNLSLSRVCTYITWLFILTSCPGTYHTYSHLTARRTAAYVTLRCVW